MLVTKSLRLGAVESLYLAEIGSPVRKTGALIRSRIAA